MTQTRIHPETGQVLSRSSRQQTVSVGSLARTVEVPGWYPDDDSDSIHSGADLQALNDAYKELRAAYAARVKSVRKKLRLTQEEAGRIIGGGRRAFQKYESGTTPPSDAAVGSGDTRPTSGRGGNLEVDPLRVPRQCHCQRGCLSRAACGGSQGHQEGLCREMTTTGSTRLGCTVRAGEPMKTLTKHLPWACVAPLLGYCRTTEIRSGDT